MIKNEMNPPIADLNAEVATLVEKHGSARTLLAILKAYFRGTPRPPDTRHLSDHLKRDIGLPERGEAHTRTGRDHRF